MSFVVHDLCCTNGHRADSVLHRRGATPECSACGAATAISWHSGEAPGLHGFGSVIVDGERVTTGDLEQVRRRLLAQNPGKDVKVTALSDRQVDERQDARRLRVAAARKARGVNLEAVRDERVEGLHRQKEQVLRATLPTTVAAAKTAQLDYKIQHTARTLKTQ